MLNWLVKWYKRKLYRYNVGDIIKIRRGLTNNLGPRYVLAEVVEYCDYTPKWGAMIALKIDGTKRIHHIWVRQTEILQITDGEAMLWKLENS